MLVLTTGLEATATSLGASGNEQDMLGSTSSEGRVVCRKHHLLCEHCGSVCALYGLMMVYFKTHVSSIFSSMNLRINASMYTHCYPSVYDISELATGGA